jgi:hypothetical protein
MFNGREIRLTQKTLLSLDTQIVVCLEFAQSPPFEEEYRDQEDKYLENTRVARASRKEDR